MTREVSDIIIALGGALIIFILLPGMIMHFATRWKMAATLTDGDEQLLEQLHQLGGRLDDRVATIERIMTAENPDWKELGDCRSDPEPSNVGSLKH